MRGILIILAAMLTSPLAANEHPEDADSAAATIRAFMTAFDAQDEAAMSALLADGAHLVMVRETEDGTQTRSLPMADLTKSIANSANDLAEPIAITAVMVEGPVAMVWADFGLYVDDTRSHCGVNIFTLVRVGGEWKLATTTYSHITDPCEGAPTP